jgi:hypothetical protein
MKVPIRPEAVSQVISGYYLPFIIRAPTGKPIGSECVTEFEPTALVVGA